MLMTGLSMRQVPPAFSVETQCWIPCDLSGGTGHLEHIRKASRSLLHQMRRPEADLRCALRRTRDIAADRAALMPRTMPARLRSTSGSATPAFAYGGRPSRPSETPATRMPPARRRNRRHEQPCRLLTSVWPPAAAPVDLLDSEAAGRPFGPLRRRSWLGAPALAPAGSFASQCARARPRAGWRV